MNKFKSGDVVEFAKATTVEGVVKYSGCGNPECCRVTVRVDGKDELVYERELKLKKRLPDKPKPGTLVVVGWWRGLITDTDRTVYIGSDGETEDGMYSWPELAKRNDLKIVG